MSSFDDFSLQPATRAALASMNIIEPTPIQAEAIPALLAGKDLIGQSATGSGKTLAYGIPLVERLAKDKRFVQALVLLPTRELAVQVNTVLGKLAVGRRLSTALLVGGRAYGPQISALRYGAQIVVGTPGRVQDHLEQGTLVLNQLRICVLDEADEMLDIGFAPAIEAILATTPETRQMALFSATMPEWIQKIEEKFLKEPVKVSIKRPEGEQNTIEQIAYQVPSNRKMAALCTLLNSAEGESSLIFGKTKFGVEKLGKQLGNLGFTVGTLHGDKSQRAREEVLTSFRNGQVQTLLATNVAARGLDIKGIHQVINYELPESSELFTHRIGRTGRMGQQGKAITLLSPADMFKWRRMSRSLGQAVSLQQLPIAEGDVVAIPFERPKPELPAVPEYEQQQRPRRERREQFSPDQRSERREQRAPRPRRNSYDGANRELRSLPEVATRERGQVGSRRSTRNNNDISIDRTYDLITAYDTERRPARKDRRAQAEQEVYQTTPSNAKKRRSASPSQSVGRPSEDRASEGRRGARKQSSRPASRQQEVHSVVPQNRAARRAVQFGLPEQERRSSRSRRVAAGR